MARRQYWVQPSLQKPTVHSFLQGAIVILGSLFIISIVALMQVAQSPGLLPLQKEMLREGLIEMVLNGVFISILSLSLFGFVGFIYSYRSVGPLSRIEKWLHNIVENKERKPMSIRKKDQFSGFVNSVTRQINQAEGKQGGTV